MAQIDNGFGGYTELADRWQSTENALCAKWSYCACCYFAEVEGTDYDGIMLAGVKAHIPFTCVSSCVVCTCYDLSGVIDSQSHTITL